MYFYSAFGLQLESVLPLPELVATAPATPDVTISFGKLGRTRPETDETGSYYDLTSKEAYFFWDRVGALSVRDGKTITIEALPGVEENVIRLPLLGMGLAAVVQQRGCLALHASAVAVDGQAVAFVGSRGLGKSTTAAALYGRGHVLVADDLLVVDVGGPSPVALPGFPQLKLFPESAAASLGDNPDLLPRLATGYNKCARRAVNRFSLQPLLISRIYCLRFGSSLEIERLQPQEAAVQLIAQSYASRVFKNSLRGTEAANNLRQCAKVASSVPVYWLKREPSLAALPDLAQTIEQQLSRDLNWVSA